MENQTIEIEKVLRETGVFNHVMDLHKQDPEMAHAIMCLAVELWKKAHN